MMKLNNKGWGYKDMIIFTVIILIALFVATYYVIALYSSIDNPSFTESVTTNYVDYYTPKEKDLANAAKLYMIDRNIDVVGDKYKIDLDTLVRSDYISKIVDKNGKPCSGYAYVTYNGTYSANGYIKCGDYTTEGYSE